MSPSSSRDNYLHRVSRCFAKSTYVKLVTLKYILLTSGASIHFFEFLTKSRGEKNLWTFWGKGGTGPCTTTVDYAYGSTKFKG